jgi:ribokinase
MLDVISIGTASRDVYLQSPLFKPFNDPKHLKKIGFVTGEAQCFGMGAKVGVDNIHFSTGGGATNTAVTFARQGLKAGALFEIGNDQAGKDILAKLQKEKVQPIKILNRGSQTVYSTILLSSTGERTVLVYRNPDDKLTKKNIPFSRLNAKWAYLVPSDTELLTLVALMRHFKKKKTLVAVNPSKYFIKIGKRKLKPILDQFKVVILNREEAAYFTGVEYNKERKIFIKLHEMIPGIAVMTDGPKGVKVSDGFNIYSAGVFKEKKVLDRTGAGDSFGSGFVAGLIRRKEECRLGMCKPENIKYAIRLASANATSKVEQLGAKGGLLTRKEFETSTRWDHFPIDIKSL